MKLVKQFTEVTPFSKIVALILFIALPVITFWLGIKYQKDYILNNYMCIQLSDKTKSLLKSSSGKTMINLPSPTMKPRNQSK